MSKHVIKEDPPDESWIQERLFIKELLNNKNIKDVSIGQCRVKPSVTTQLHRLSVDEWYIIMEGKGAVEVGDEGIESVTIGDIVQIPAGTPQRITNTGNLDLIFLCICLPRFTPDAYQALGE